MPETDQRAGSSARIAILIVLAVLVVLGALLFLLGPLPTIVLAVLVVLGALLFLLGPLPTIFPTVQCNGCAPIRP